MSKACTAQLLTTVAKTTNQCRFLTHTDLTHVDTLMQAGTQIAHQLSKINSLIG
jgi:hypothetical protein